MKTEISAIASEFEKKIKELNDTFRPFFEDYLSLPSQEDDDSVMPESLKINLQTQIHDLYLHIIHNYNKLPTSKRIEISYQDPLQGTSQKILISTAIRYTFAFYLRIAEDFELVIDPDTVKFGNDVIDNYLIVL